MTDERKITIANKIRKILKEDILWRYDNSEYWDFDIDPVNELLSSERNNISEKDRQDILNLIEE
jgi:hypothetical protein